MTAFHPLILAVFVLGSAYFFTALYLLSQKAPRREAPAPSPRVDVLVAMRNEALHISACLESLAAQTYSKELYNVYILDDHSTDRSPALVASFIKGHPNFHLFSIREEVNGLSGKMNALAQGIQQTEGEIILITDADCIVPQNWIARQVEYFTPTTGLVGALTLLEAPPSLADVAPPVNFFGRIQALDWLFLQSVAAFASYSGKPISVLGNNFGFRRAAYESVGGFAGIGFSITEDFALMRALSRQGHWEIRHTLDSDAAIFSHPVRHISAFFSQRLRWVKGGRKARPFGYFIMGISFLTYLSILLTFLSGLWSTPAALGIGLTVGVNYLIIKQQLRRLRMTHLLKYFIPFQIFQMLYVPVFAVLAFLPLPLHWKGRRFQ